MKGNIFKNVMMSKVGSNRFDLSHDVKMSFNMGELIPSCVMDVVPGDKLTISTEKMLRFAPLVSPMMHKVHVTCHYFFVPNRILWANWEDFITGNGDHEAPHTKGTNDFPNGSIADYLGIPQATIVDQTKVSCLPCAAYVKIWDEYYRDQNLQAERFTPLVDGDNDAAYFDIQEQSPFKRAWQHDYFTSCLPFAQKGDEVELPLLQDQTVDVTLKGPGNTPVQIVKDQATHAVQVSSDLVTGPAGEVRAGAGGDSVIDPNGSLQIDISDEATTINTLRRAFRLQEWLEKNARGGTRYIESILAHFGVRSSDKRLQRPEYLGGSKANMVISEVLSTAQTVDQSMNDVPVGQMAGHGIAVGGGNKFTYKAEEHGWVIGILNVQPTTAYQQGLHRMFTREDRLDYYWPTFANIGEQAVKNKEIFISQTAQDQEETFGYIPRYSEYKYLNNRVAGDFKDTLAFWHLGRIFGSAPALNEEFIECDPDHRVFAVTDPAQHKIWAHVFNNISAIRKMPKYGVPTI